MTPIQTSSLVQLVALLALCPLVALAQFPSIPPPDIYGIYDTKTTKANASRLSFDDQGLAYLNIKTKRKKPDGSGWEDNVRRVLFTGVAFWDEPWGRAEVTYLSGVLHGEVTVVAGKKLLARFFYENGKKALPSATSANGETSPEVSSEAGDKH